MQDGSTNTEVIENVNLKGKVYLFSIEFDTTNCKVIGGCDCCASHVVFLDDKEFVTVTYCTGDERYTKGSYTINDTSLVLSYGNQCVLNEYNWEKEIDTTGTIKNEYNVKVEKRKPLSVIIDQFYCKNELCFKVGDEQEMNYGVQDTISASVFVEQMKQDGIWDKLNRN